MARAAPPRRPLLTALALLSLALPALPPPLARASSALTAAAAPPQPHLNATTTTTPIGANADADTDEPFNPSAIEVVRFAHARVAIHTAADAHSLGDQLWACTQAAQALAGCRAPAPPPPPLPSSSQQQQPAGDGGGAGCAFLELGGPGLCAFSLARRHPQLAVTLLPTSARLAGLSAAMNGRPRNLRLLPSGGGLEDAGGAELLDSAVPHGGTAVVHVNMYDGTATAATARLAAARAMLAARAGAVRAVVLMLPAGAVLAAAGGDGGGAATVAADQDLAAGVASTLQNAAAAGFQAFAGGFDGAPVADLPALAAMQSVGGAPPRRLPRARPALLGLYLARRAAPPPSLHVFAPLRASGGANATSLLSAFCANLAATAAAAALGELHLTGWGLPDTSLDHPAPRTQKLLALHRALRAVPPTDVVVALDALDSLAQAGSAELLAGYLRAGAPVLRASTEVDCWPQAVYPWCSLYGRNPHPALDNAYINSGGYIGRAIVLARFLYDAVEFLQGRLSPASWIPSSCAGLGVNDQALMACPYLFGNRYGVSLDYASAFFFSVFRAAHHLEPRRGGDQEEQGQATRGPQGRGVWADRRTNVTPAFLHCNGGDGRRSLERLRQGLVPPPGGGDSPPGAVFSLLLNGRRVQYADLCG